MALRRNPGYSWQNFEISVFFDINSGALGIGPSSVCGVTLTDFRLTLLYSNIISDSNDIIIIQIYHDGICFLQLPY